MVVRLKLLIICILSSMSFHVNYGQTWKVYPYQPPNSVLNFPADEGYHPEQPIEWWYISGHLTGSNTGHAYAFMISYFHYPAYGYEGFRIFDLIDLTNGNHTAETLPCNYPLLSTSELNLIAAVFTRANESWKTKTDGNNNLIPFEYQLNAASLHESLNLDCTALKPPLIVGDSGYFKQGINGYTYYYSLTSLAVSGSVKMNGITEPVSGNAWIDRQFGSFNPYEGENYEWFALQLANGTELNLWNIFTAQNQIPQTSAYQICTAMLSDNSKINIHEFKLSRLGYAYTSDREKCYATKWRLIIDTLNLDIEFQTFNVNNENLLPFRFFEGPLYITGKADGETITGKGFAELLHSYSKPDLSVIYPLTTMEWDRSKPINWKLNNPDAGNPLNYRIDLLTNSGRNILHINPPSEKFSFYIDPALFTDDTIIKVKMAAQSVDSTLNDTSEVKAFCQAVHHFYHFIEGESFSLGISLYNNSDYTYQWLLNDKEITGETDSLLDLPSLSIENSGLYRCYIQSPYFNDTTFANYILVTSDEVTYQYTTVCNGDSYYTGTRWVSRDGIYIDSLISFSGSDSLVITELHVSDCTLLKENIVNQTVQIFSDFTNDKIYIKFNQPFTGKMLIYDLMGRLIKEFKSCGQFTYSVDTANLLPNIYILSINGNIGLTRKFIKVAGIK